MTEKHFPIELNTGDTISAVLHLPAAKPRSTGIAIAHGAANDLNHPLIMAFARGMALKGFPCLRFNFSYREKQKKSVDHEHKLIHAWARALEELERSSGCQRCIAAGKSLGARVAAQGTAAQELAPDGLIFLGYPLHAPGKKDCLRDAPLYEISCPMLFFEGTRDPFCDLESFRAVYKKIDAPKALMVIENGDHGFGLPKSDPRPEQEIHTAVVEKSAAWLAEAGLI